MSDAPTKAEFREILGRRVKHLEIHRALLLAKIEEALISATPCNGSTIGQQDVDSDVLDRLRETRNEVRIAIQQESAGGYHKGDAEEDAFFPSNEKLAPTFKRFADLVRRAGEEALGDIEAEYLPHLASDLYCNATGHAERIVISFLAGDGDHSYILRLARGHSGRSIRDRIYEEHREEIEKSIGDDLRKEIESLKQTLEVFRA